MSASTSNPRDAGATETDGTDTKVGFVAILGAPNAGKSTLVNALVGEKISIVTHKVQTTRFQIRGIAMSDTTQMILVDTPGIFEPRKDDRLARAMVHAAWGGTESADVLIHVVDADAYLRQTEGVGTAQDRLSVDDSQRVTEGLRLRDTRPRFLALNKIDEVERSTLLSLIETFSAHGVYDDIFLISAQTGDGLETLRAAIEAALPLGPFLFPPDQAADIPQRVMASEITREKLFLRLHDELPYASMVETEKWTKQRNGNIRIDQVIYVQRPTQKPIVLGKGGATIRDIGTAARKEMEAWLGTKVHLFLFVKVREKWRDDRERYAGTGLEFDI